MPFLARNNTDAVSPTVGRTLLLVRRLRGRRPRWQLKTPAAAATVWPNAGSKAAVTRPMPTSTRSAYYNYISAEAADSKVKAIPFLSHMRPRC
eukprot:3657999-Pleurochrysis_carterae.AAC.2